MHVVKYQSRQIVITLVMALSLLGRAATGAWAANAGLIVTASGDVQVKSPDSGWSAAGSFTGLANDSHIKVGDRGSAIVVLYKDGSRFQASAGSTLTVTENAVQSTGGPALTRLPSLKLQHVALLQSSRIAGGRPAAVTLRDPAEAVIEVRSLGISSTLDSRPNFSWESIKDATSYKIRVWDAENKLIWQKDVPGDSCAYPADAPLLKPGVEYIWEINTATAAGNYKGEGLFTVMEPDKKAAVAAELEAVGDLGDESATDTIKIEIYSRYNLWDDAISTYKKLNDRTPGSPVVLDNLAKVLGDQGQHRLAAKYHAMADQAATQK